jgi:hypothetical protein
MPAKHWSIASLRPLPDIDACERLSICSCRAGSVSYESFVDFDCVVYLRRHVESCDRSSLSVRPYSVLDDLPSYIELVRAWTRVLVEKMTMRQTQVITHKMVRARRRQVDGIYCEVLQVSYHSVLFRRNLDSYAQDIVLSARLVMFRGIVCVVKVRAWAWWGWKNAEQRRKKTSCELCRPISSKAIQRHVSVLELHFSAYCFARYPSGRGWFRDHARHHRALPRNAPMAYQALSDRMSTQWFGI